MTEWVPDSGDILWLSLDQQIDHEQGDRRPFLVLSPQRYNSKTSLIAGCPIAMQAKNYPFEVHLPDSAIIRGVVLADQIKNLDWRGRRAEFVEGTTATVLHATRELIGLFLSITATA